MFLSLYRAFFTGGKIQQMIFKDIKTQKKKNVASKIYITDMGKVVSMLLCFF